MKDQISQLKNENLTPEEFEKRVKDITDNMMAEVDKDTPPGVDYPVLPQPEIKLSLALQQKMEGVKGGVAFEQRTYKEDPHSN